MTRPVLSIALLGLSLPAPAAEPLSVRPREVPGRDALFPPGAVRRFDPTRLRHPGGISGSALSADGKWLATAARRSVAVWDLATGAAVHRFDTGSASHYSTQKLAFSPDGQWLAACPGSSQVFVWDLTTGATVKRFERKEFRGGGYEFVAFAAGRQHLVVTEAGRVTVSDTRTWDPVRSFDGRPKLLSATGTLVGLGPRSSHVVFTDLGTGKMVAQPDAVTEMDGLSNGLAVAPDGKTAAVYRSHGEVELWSVPGAERLRGLKVPAPDRYHTVAFSGDGKLVLFGTTSGVAMWEAATGRALPRWDRQFDSNFGRLTGLHTLPDGDTVLACAEDGLVHRFSLKAAKELPPPDGYSGRVVAGLSADGRLLAAGDRAGRADLWDLATGRRLRTVTEKGPAVSLVALAPDGKTVAVGRDTGAVELRDAGTGDLRHTLTTPGGAQYKHVRSLFFSPDGRMVLGRNWGDRLQSWDTSTGRAGWVRPQDCASAFRPDGKVLVCAVGGPDVAFVDPATGAGLRLVKVDTQFRAFDAVPALAFSPDGSRLVLATADRMLRFSDPVTAAERAKVEAVDLPDDPFQLRMALDAGVRALAFSPDGRWLATGGSDCSVRVWEVDTRREVRRFDGHDRWVTAVGFGPGGRTVVSAGEDGAIIQWDPRPSAPGKAGRSAWEDLASADAAVAYRAVWALADDPAAAVTLLRANVPPAKGVPKEQIDRLVAGLDAPRFADRESATKALAGFGRLAGPALKAALAGKLSAEAKERAERLLAALDADPVGEELRRSRAAQALELAGTAKARALLREWAAGAPGARLTEDAAAALARLAGRAEGEGK